jgi:hypothetical protein
VGERRPSEVVVEALALDAALALSNRAPCGDREPDALVDLAAGLCGLSLADWARSNSTGTSGMLSSSGSPTAQSIPPVELRPIALPAPLRRRSVSRLQRLALAGAAASVAFGAVVGVVAAIAGQGTPPLVPAASSRWARIALVADRSRLVSGSAHRRVLGTVRAIACPTATECLLLADVSGPGSPSVVARSSDGGRTWIVSTTGLGGSQLASISCAAPPHCVAVGEVDGRGAVRVTSDSGSRWERASVPPSVSSLEAVSCPTVVDCAAVGVSGSRPAVLTSTDGGRTWVGQTVAEPARGSAVVSALACPTASRCDAVVTSAAGSVVVPLVRDSEGWAAGAPYPTVPRGRPEPSSAGPCPICRSSPRATGAGSAAVDGVLSVACTTPVECWAVGPGGAGQGEQAAVAAAVRVSPAPGGRSPG